MGAAKGPACDGIAAVPESKLPHVSATGPKASAILTALEAALSAHAPPIATGHAYAASRLGCRSIDTPSAQGWACTFDVRVDTGAAVDVTVDAPEICERLYDALSAGGAKQCVDPHGQFVNVEDLTLTADSAEYDDASNYKTYAEPDVVVQGADAERIVKAFAAAGIDDCADTEKVFLICSTFSGAPSCGYQRLGLEQVGASTLQPICGPGSGGASRGGDLSQAASRDLWTALIDAAKSAGYKPINGTLDDVSVINARWFGWDGAKLGFTLVADNATPPSSPSGP
jgi:hypothetical protein